jgi:hypothetical protein
MKLRKAVGEKVSDELKYKSAYGEGSVKHLRLAQNQN